MNRNTDTIKGFTLIELLVVIAIIALLLSILLPSLSLAKDTAKRIGCSANLRSLAMAAIFYAEENDGLTPSSTNIWADNGVSRAGWVGQTSSPSRQALDIDVQVYGNGTDQFTGLHKSQLWNYIENTKGWRCPTDPDKEQLRSYCMAGQWWGRHYEIPIEETRHPSHKPHAHIPHPAAFSMRYSTSELSGAACAHPLQRLVRRRVCVVSKYPSDRTLTSRSSHVPQFVLTRQPSAQSPLQSVSR